MSKTGSGNSPYFILLNALGGTFDVTATVLLFLIHSVVLDRLKSGRGPIRHIFIKSDVSFAAQQSLRLRTNAHEAKMQNTSKDMWNRISVAFLAYVKVCGLATGQVAWFKLSCGHTHDNIDGCFGTIARSITTWLSIEDYVDQVT